ncbi:hypothetical protein LSH36_1093g00032 [Paralvinella palmiformis]|uniref:TrmE-type G domain-containing protein n=1 Tax=Paralvinella palmiformis TaxID=53620 RepID=A0AAD9IVJ6_9ANNE|nr:hypothetical protein LSH36_1093g00032 [Paralvinella palmiformis]
MGQASVERGFSLNKQTEKDNMSEGVIVALRQIIDYFVLVGGMLKVESTKELLYSASSSRYRYHQYLEEDKRKKGQEAIQRKRKTVQDEVDDLKKRKNVLQSDITNLTTSSEKYADEAEEKEGKTSHSILVKSNALRDSAKQKRGEIAFEHGKLDLTEVEGLADLIHAETEAQRLQALRQMEGSLSKLYAQWRSRLLKCCANVEAFIDFSEEENIEAGVVEQVERDIKSVISEIEQHLHDNRRGERLRNGVHIAIIGKPNVGKSSLLNLLCQRPAAIVSPIPGTTRDIVETALNFGGYPVLISDTAGLRETQDDVENEGVRRAVTRARNADIKIIVADLTQTGNILLSVQDPGISTTVESFSQPQLLTEFFISHLGELGLFNENNRDISSSGMADTSSTEFHVEDCILLFNKVDLVLSDKQNSNTIIHGKTSGLVWCCISCITEEGLDHFLNVLQAKVKDMCHNPNTGNPSLTQARHREHLSQCLQALHGYLNFQHTDVVLAASSLQVALRHIGKITGKITSKEILDIVFKDFCIGK